MTLQVNIPDSLVRQANELAERQHVTVDQLVAAALAAQISCATRPAQHRRTSQPGKPAAGGRHSRSRASRFAVAGR